MEATKRCPYCAEEILAAAIKCKHCHSNLESPPPLPIVDEQPTARKPPHVAVRIIGILGLTAAAIWFFNSPSKVTEPPSLSVATESTSAQTQTPPPVSAAAPAPAAPPRTTPEKPAHAVPDDTAILNDADALDTKYGTEAGIRCASEADDYLRSAVRYDFKWDKLGFVEFKFDRYLTAISSPGVLTVLSKKVAIQNGFGAYEHIDLFCDFDTQSKKGKKVLGYSINTPNHMPSNSPPAAVDPSSSDHPANDPE